MKRAQLPTRKGRIAGRERWMRDCLVGRASNGHRSLLSCCAGGKELQTQLPSRARRDLVSLATTPIRLPSHACPRRIETLPTNETGHALSMTRVAA